MTSNVWLVGQAVSQDDDRANALFGEGLAGGDGQSRRANGGDGDALVEVDAGVGNGDGFAPGVINTFRLETQWEAFAAAEESTLSGFYRLRGRRRRCGWPVP